MKIVIPALWAAFSDILTPFCNFSISKTDFVYMLADTSLKLLYLAKEKLSHWEHTWIFVSFCALIQVPTSSEMLNFPPEPILKKHNFFVIISLVKLKHRMIFLGCLKIIFILDYLQ